MDWKFILLSLIGLFGIIHSLLSSRGKEREHPFSSSLYLKSLGFAVPLLLFTYFFLKPPFATHGAVPLKGYGIGILLGGIASFALLSTLRLPSSSRLIASFSIILLFATCLYLFPYDLSFLSFGFILSLALFLFLFSSLKENLQEDLLFLSNLSLILILSLIFGVYHRDMSEKKLPEFLWFLLPLSLFSISILSYFLPFKRASLFSILQIFFFYLIFSFALTYFYLQFMIPFYIIAGGAVTGAIFLSLILSQGLRNSSLHTISVLLLLGLLVFSFRFLRAYGVCLSALSLLPFASLIFSNDDPSGKRSLNLFLFPISSLLIFRLFYQFFSSSRSATPPTIYDFFPLIGIIAGALLFLFLSHKRSSSTSCLLIFLLSLVIYSFLVSIWGLNTAIGIFAGFLLASFLSFSLRDSEPAPLSIFFLLLALLLTPKLSPLSFQLKRLYKFYITLGAVPISVFILYLLSRREERGR
ncbi:hypothetical protein H5T88_06550 [bacterium]|nr:hypothetical protein [bacterium]